MSHPSAGSQLPEKLPAASEKMPHAKQNVLSRL